MRLALLTIAASVVISSCSPQPCAQLVCGACYPALSLQTVDAGGNHVAVTVSGTNASGEPVTCTPEASTSCPLFTTVTGTYTLELSASGFQTQTITVVVEPEPAADPSHPRCCGCGYVPRFIEVTME